jgi:hypothetical protein
MGGVREGVLEGTGERARECSGARERKRRVLSDSTREWRRKQHPFVLAVTGHMRHACVTVVWLRLPPMASEAVLAVEFGVVLG